MAFGAKAPAVGGFKRGAAAPVAVAASAPAQTRGSRWAGMDFGDSREPMLEVGMYRLRIARCEKKIKPRGAPNAGRESFAAHVEVLEAADGAGSPAGGAFVVISLLSTDAGAKEMGRLVVAASGYEPEEFNAAFGDGSLIDAVLGDAPGVANPIAGRLVDVQVTRGKDDSSGGWYRNYQWQIVDEDDQSSGGGVPRPEGIPF